MPFFNHLILKCAVPIINALHANFIFTPPEKYIFSIHAVVQAEGIFFYNDRCIAYKNLSFFEATVLTIAKESLSILK
jgi:hypothetical protein